jgi:P4 family phage/plasmid primase-like protien
LKEDNYEVFTKLQSRKHKIKHDLLAATHATVADAFYEMNPNAYLFVQEGWFVLQSNNVWNGTGSTEILSIPDIINHIRKDCGDVLENLKMNLDRNTDEGQANHKALLNAIRQISNVAFVRGVACFLKGLYYRKEPIKFNDKRRLFAFTNGVMDFTTQPAVFRDVEPEDYITVTCGYEYRHPTAEEKTMVRDVIKKIFPANDVMKYVLGALSRTFVGSNSGQWFHVFTGMGANGKSLLMELCKMVFGGYYQTFSVTYLTKESDGKDHPMPELAAARYARMLVTSEPDERDKFQVNMLKNLTGDEEVTFRGMFAKMVIPYIPQFLIWILTNDLPRLSKYGPAVERRMRLVHFCTRFVYAPRAENEALRDDTLSRRFREEEGWRYGMLGLLLDEYSPEPLEMPQEVKDVTDAYMLENNPVGAWLRQHYTITERREDVVQKTELYRTFLADTGIQKSQKAFSEDMVKCSINEKKTKEGIRFYYGIVRKEVNEENL